MNKDTKRINKGLPIICSKCGMAGGSLVKQGDEYVHQDTTKCMLLQLRRK